MLYFHVDHSHIKYYIRCGTLKMQNPRQTRERARERVKNGTATIFYLATQFIWPKIFCKPMMFISTEMIRPKIAGTKQPANKNAIHIVYPKNHHLVQLRFISIVVRRNYRNKANRKRKKRRHRQRKMIQALFVEVTEKS